MLVITKIKWCDSTDCITNKHNKCTRKEVVINSGNCSDCRVITKSEAEQLQEVLDRCDK